MSDLFMSMHHKKHRSRAEAAHAAKNAGRSTDSFSTTSTTTTSAQCGRKSKAKHPRTENDNTNEEDEFANILSLKLKKPKNWNWELSTSRSCSNIALPRILLYNHKNELLVDADGLDDQVYIKDDYETQKRSNSHPRKRNSKRSVTSNLTQSIKQALNKEFNSLSINEATPSPEPSLNRQRLYHRQRSASAAGTASLSSPIDFFTNELSDYHCEARSDGSSRGVRFSDAIVCSADSGSINGAHLVSLPTPPSTTTTTPTTASTSSGPTREKRRYRRSQSSAGRSDSILERFSYTKGRYSSPEFDAVPTPQQIEYAPRYFLRTSRAGTLVIAEDSFSRHPTRRRRKPKNSSSENLLNEGSSKSQSTNSLNASKSHKTNKLNLPSDKDLSFSNQAQSLQNITELPEIKEKTSYRIRRHRSDGNFLLANQLSTSEEEQEHFIKQPNQGKIIQRKYSRKQSKKDLVGFDSSNNVLYGQGGPTSR